jgi:uncharacterized protein (TIGR02118 family)
MHTIAFLFKRRPGMSLDEFHRHYEKIHGPIARTLPGLVEYRQYPIRSVGLGDVHFKDASGFDGLSIYVFESPEAANAAWQSSENQPVQEDTLQFIDLDTMITLPVTLRTVLEVREVARND